MSAETVLFAVAGLVLAAKLGGLVAERLRQPAVLGELVTGIVLANGLAAVAGASGIGALRGDATVHVLAELGVLLLLFEVGLEADLRAFARVGLSSVLVALAGVAAPFALGWATSAWLLPDRAPLVHVFIGAALTATSVGITARVLRDLGASERAEASTIVGAALVDDVLGLVVLAVVSGSVTAAAGGGSVSWPGIALIVVEAAAFLGLAVVAGHVLSGPLVRLVGRAGPSGLILAVGIALCFTLAVVARAIGLAGIVGAFAAGLVLDPYGTGVRAKEDERTLAELLHPLGAFFVPLFFVVMGLQVDLTALTDPTAMAVGGVLVVAAVLGKLACALGVVGRGIDRLAVALGMIPRGEVGLIFAGIGANLGLLDDALFSALVLMVVVTTLVTPPALRWRLGAGAASRGSRRAA